MRDTRNYSQKHIDQLAIIYNLQSAQQSLKQIFSSSFHQQHRHQSNLQMISKKNNIDRNTKLKKDMRASLFGTYFQKQPLIQQIEMSQTIWENRLRDNFDGEVNQQDNVRLKQDLPSAKQQSMKQSDMNQITYNFEKNKRKKQIGDPDYDIWDLTYTLWGVNIPIVLTIILFIVLLLIRYYTIAFLISIAVRSKGKHLMWLVVVIGDRILYFILVVKVSLKSPETKTEITLKAYWNSKESEMNELFSVTNKLKLLKSILRGIIPAELAFLYIQATPRKKFEAYTAINYIYSSIEAIVYYPFFIIYTSVFMSHKYFDLNRIFDVFTLALTVVAELIMLGLSIFLLKKGIEKKYDKILFCF